MVAYYYKDVLETANWASAKTVYTLYFKDVVHVKNNFADKILNYLLYIQEDIYPYHDCVIVV